MEEKKKKKKWYTLEVKAAPQVHIVVTKNTESFIELTHSDKHGESDGISCKSSPPCERPDKRARAGVGASGGFRCWQQGTRAIETAEKAETGMWHTS